jgi:uncharacterized protein (DUF2147 family)
MKKLFFITALFLLSSASSSFAQSPDAILGQWITEGEKSYVEIYKCEQLYCGKIVWLKNPKDEEGREKVDKKNPDESLRNRKLLGLPILWSFRHNGENLWENGKIYDPQDGKTYSCKMTLEGEKLKVRGFIGFSLLGRTAVWTRKS